MALLTVDGPVRVLLRPRNQWSAVRSCHTPSAWMKADAEAYFGLWVYTDGSP